MTSDTMGSPLELLSALFDDELVGRERDRAIRIAQRAEAGRRALSDYADVDDALRNWFSGADTDDLFGAFGLDDDSNGETPRPPLADEPGSAERDALDLSEGPYRVAPSSIAAGLRFAAIAAALLAAAAWLLSALTPGVDTATATADARLSLAIQGRAVDAVVVGGALSENSGTPSGMLSSVRADVLSSVRLRTARGEVWHARVDDGLGPIELFAAPLDGNSATRCDQTGERERCRWSAGGWRFVAQSGRSALSLSTRVSVLDRLL